MEKVMCPWCGNEMEPDEIVDPFSGEVFGYSGYSCDCGAVSPYATQDHSLASAYAAATRRPPNLPLSKEQIKGMSHTDALWLIRKGEVAGVFVGSVLSVLCSLVSYHKNYSIFAAKPSQADIESARNA